MIEDDKTLQEAKQKMERTNPECPNCHTRGEWKYGGANILNSYDSEKDVTYIKPLVEISCAKCRTEMDPYVGEN
jgi:hypothetical protein